MGKREAIRVRLENLLARIVDEALDDWTITPDVCPVERFVARRLVRKLETLEVRGILRAFDYPGSSRAKQTPGEK